VASLQRFHTVLKHAERRVARCANASNGVETLCNRLERHAAAFILSVLKTNARLGVCTAFETARCGNAVGSS